MSNVGAVLSVSGPTALSPSCGCWPACYVRTESGDIARCSVCADPVSLSCDVEPYLEEGERLVWVADAAGRDALAYFTESEESDNDDA